MIITQFRVSGRDGVDGPLALSRVVVERGHGLVTKLLPSMEVLPVLVLALSPRTATQIPVQVTGTSSHTSLQAK